ncbi:5-hydroxytryptamine receptor 1D-like [Paramacrobiotus metropolitanus]|uniref:5-hydroxytryptamine receptor 1D-like n=1 Tax=Paramacrobiotus metropolitanus TaxID=2943436 RepID=UPI002446271C|nr:5-hydroxytryptamine receptor 1D-like [Paramacrobiotus metropolitanus]
MPNVSASITVQHLSNISSSYEWSFTPVSEIIISPISVLLNSYCLFLFLTNKKLHTAFNVYLGNLLFANLMYTILNNPLGIINGLYRIWPLGTTACNVYTYSLSAFGAMTVNSHAFITLNRLWAVTFPINYRKHHGIRTSLFTVFLLWIYVHLICLPGIVIDARYFRLAFDKNRCILNGSAQPVWNNIVQFVLYVGPVCIILITYPYVFVRERQRRPIRFSVSVRSARVAKPTPDVSAGKTAVVPAMSSAGRNYAFTVMTLLTASILICWVPNVTYYTVTGFTGTHNHSTLLAVTLLFALQSVMDPILFVLALGDLRLAFFSHCVYQKRN